MAYTTINKGSDYFNTVLYTGNGGTNNITGVEFQPDWVWIKTRSEESNHMLFDIIRGTGKELHSQNTEAEITSATTLTSFDSDGFTLGNNGNLNRNTETYASWNWLAANGTASNTDGSIASTVSANTTSGFSIVSYTGTGSNATVGHGLGVAPKMIIIKNRSAVTHWMVGCDSIAWTNYLVLSLSQESISDSQVWNNTAPTSNVFSVGVASPSNGSGNNLIAYCFAEKKGFSKFGSYTGNGSADGPFIYTGFKPAFFMYKRTDAAGYNWIIYDNKRDTYNYAYHTLFPNSSAADPADTLNAQDILSNGFKIRNTYENASGSTYIYMAFAENPFVGSDGTPTTAR